MEDFLKRVEESIVRVTDADIERVSSKLIIPDYLRDADLVMAGKLNERKIKMSVVLFDLQNSIISRQGVGSEYNVLTSSYMDNPMQMSKGCPCTDDVLFYQQDERIFHVVPLFLHFHLYHSGIQ